MISGIGVDIVEIKRINLNIARKILSIDELQIYEEMSVDRKREFLAGRFAVKEALYKAGVKVSFDLLNIKYNEDNSIYLADYPQVKISISHERDYAIGFVIVND